MTTAKSHWLRGESHFGPGSTLLVVCVTIALSYLVPHLIGRMTSNPQTVWPLWPGCAILVSGLVLVRVSIWPLVIAASFLGFAVADFQAGVPLGSIVRFIPGNTMEVLISAVGLRYCFDGVPRLNSVKAFAKYSFFAIILGPLAGAFLSAHGIARDYWMGWKIVVLSEALAFITLAPALLSWVTEGRALMRRSRAHHIEGVMLIAGLVLVSYIVFTVREDSRSPALFYTLVPFLLWSALRFGWLGVSTSLIAVTSLSIWGAIYGRGPFSNMVPLTDPLPLQIFLIFASIPFMVLAVLSEERAEAAHVVRESEERLRLAQWAAHIGTFDVDLQTGVDIWPPETEALYGLPPGGFGGTLTAFENLVHPHDRQRIIQLSQKMMKTGQPADGEWRVIWPDGSIHWIAGRGQVLMDDSGQPSRMLGVNIDVTERKLAEEALSEMTRKLVEAQEQERSRIGRELHDDINQRLAMLAVELEHLKENPSELESRVEELRKQAADISNDVQALSHELHSSKLDYLGVVAGIKSWCREFGERQRLQIDWRHDVQSTLPQEIGICLFRVLQEALHNAVKHSGVKRIEVELSENSGEVHLTITDSGKGFDVEAVKQGRGLGLTSMQERVRLVNGSIVIQSKPMGGTAIHVRVPLKVHHVQQAS